jgi:hypothetical protein
MAVYFIRAGENGPVKIGRAKNPSQRMAILQTSHWQELRLMRAIEGRASLESALHRHYRGLHIRGEWFAFCPTMASIEAGDVGHLITSAPVLCAAMAEFLGEVEAHLERTKTKASAFGKRALGDPGFVANLRRGREPRWSTAQRVRAFIASHTDGSGRT